MKTEEKLPGKSTKKWWRVLFYLLLTLVMLPVVIALLLLIPAVQTTVVHWASSLASRQLQTEVYIESIYLKPFSELSLNGVLVRDLNDDTLLYAANLEAELMSFQSEPLSFELGDVALDSAYFNLYRSAEDSLLNLDFILDAFASEDTTSGGDFALFAGNVSLTNARFHYDDYLVPVDSSDQIDWSHIGISNLNTSISDVFIKNANVHATIDSLRLLEQSGFRIHQFFGDATVTDTLIQVNSMKIESGETTVYGSYAMHYDSWSSYADFIDAVELSAHLDESNVHFDDLAYFSSVLKGILAPVQVTGDVRGTISDLKASLSSLKIGSSSEMIGKVKLKGLPDITNTFIDADFDKLFITISDVQQLKFPSAQGLYSWEVPAQVQRLRYADFTGNYVGFFSDFVAYGKLATHLGELNADVNVKSPNDTLQYTGNIETNQFALGTMLGDENTLGNFAFNLNVDGLGTALENLSVKAKGAVSKAELLGYSYSNVEVDGTLSDQVFNGNVYMNDSNARLDFNGLVNFGTEIPQIDCKSNIERLHLARLNLVPTDTHGVLSGKIDMKMEGKSLDMLHGNLFVTDIQYINDEMNVALDTLSLRDDLIENGHDILIQSNIGTAHVVGATNLFQLPFAFLQTARPYLPRFIDKESYMNQDTNQVFDFELTVKENQQLFDLIGSGISWNGTLASKGSLNAAAGEFDFRLQPIDWKIRNMTFDSTQLFIAPVGDSLQIDFTSSKFTSNNALFLENLKVQSILTHDSLASKLSWYNQTSQADSGFVDLSVYRNDSFLLNAQLNELKVRVADVTWSSQKKAELHADTAFIAVNGLALESTSGSIRCDGSWSEDLNEHLVFNVADFDLSYISNFGVFAQHFEGMFDGQIDMYQKNKSFVADANVLVDSLIVDGFEIGTVQGATAYRINDRALGVNLDLSYRGDRNVHVNGDFYPFDQEEQLKMTASFDQFRALTIEPFISEYVSELGGMVNGSVKITGLAARPKVSGKLNLADFQAKVIYLNTAYNIPKGTFNIQPDFIGMVLAATSEQWIYDQEGNKSELVLSVFHENYTNFTYEVFLNGMDHFTCLNTTLADNQDYYGTAVLSGDVTISGYSAETTIDVAVSTDKGTNLSIPLSGTQNVGQADFIRFVKKKDKKVATQEGNLAEDETALKLNFQLEVDEDATVQLIFDQKVGDIIKVNGNGDMLMNIDNRGTFNMFGDYVISSGDYLFTLQNVINKKFNVQPGSRLVWSGSPYDANIDLTAIYSLRTSPRKLVEGFVENPEEYDQRTPVDVYLTMGNKLSDPLLDFEVELPNLSETDIANQMLDPATTSKEEINRQTFSLLLTKNFMSRNALGGAAQNAGSTLENSSYEMISNQLSNLISQYFDNVDVGVNYQPGDDLNAQQTELAVSTELFNDRVLLEVNGSVQGDNPNQDETNNIAGEFNLEYKITKDGSFRGRVFNESNNYNPTNLNQSPYTQGVGVFYREEFDTWGELFKKIFKRKKTTKTDSTTTD